MCQTNGPVVGLGFCAFCASATGWSRVPADNAGAGHAHLVLWCLDNGWEYTESVMEAAAKEVRSNVIVALVEKGFSCRVHVDKAAPSDVRGHRLIDNDDPPAGSDDPPGPARQRQHGGVGRTR